MTSLILNSFPAEVSPPKLVLPFLDFSTWEDSTAERKRRFSEFRTYRYDATPRAGDGPAAERRVRLVLLSGASAVPQLATEEMDVGTLPKLGCILIENALADHLRSRGMTIKWGRFEKFALRRVDEWAGHHINIYSGIAFSARRPFREALRSFVLTVQWVARATFSETLAEQSLWEMCRGLGVLYTPGTRPPEELGQFENRYIGHVREILAPDRAEVMCKDNVRRPLTLRDLTLEASPEALRRYEQMIGSPRAPSTIWKRLQQLSKVLTPQGRRNPLVLRERLEAIRSTLGGGSKEHLVLPLLGFGEGTISIGLAPERVEVS
jgi:hypothetical protein